MQIKNCLYCGKEFEDIYNRGRRFCCKNCTRMYWRKFVNPELHQKSSKAYYNKIMSDEILHEKKKQYERDINSSLKARYIKIKASAKHRGYEFNLTRDQYEECFYNSKCYYCGGDTVGGIDRINNIIGYTLENSVPCCLHCNIAKNTYSQQEFYKHCKQIITIYEDRLNIQSRRNP